MSSQSGDKQEGPSAVTTSEGLEGINCEWCDEPARLKIPMRHKIKGKKVGLIPNGMHVICCYNHEQLAREMAKNDD